MILFNDYEQQYFFLSLFLLSSTFFSALLPASPLPSPPTSPKVPKLPIYSADLVFFYFPCRLDLCKFLLGSSLQSKVPGIVICGLVFFALFFKTTYEWVHVIIVFLCLGYLIQNNVFQLHPFSCKIQAVVIFSAVQFSTV